MSIVKPVAFYAGNPAGGGSTPGGGTFPNSPSLPHEVSVDFDGSTEGMQSDDGVVLPLGNNFSVMMWLNPNAAAANDTVIDTGTSTGGGQDFRVLIRTNLAAATYDLEIRNVGGTVVKRYRNTGVTANVWTQFLFTVDTSLAVVDQLEWYIDGADSTPTLGVDNDVTDRSSNNLQVLTLGFSQSGTANWRGLIHSVAIWDKTLTSDEVVSLYNSGAPANLNLQEDFGDYSSSDNLKHWFLLGNDSSDIGKDYGSEANIDLMANAVDITAADIVSDFPS